MARSFKKFPGFSDSGKRKKAGKKFAARKVRHAKGVSNGGHYKKFYEQWDICDYKSVWFSRNSYWEWCKKDSWRARDGNLKGIFKLFYDGIGK